MAGYSGTPLVRKLGIGPGHSLAFPGAPEGFRELLGDLPDGVVIKRRAVRPLDVAVAFFRRSAELERRFDSLAAAIYPDGGLWIGWPKRAAGLATDISEDSVREIALPRGLVDNKVCAIDETWSGLRLVHRRENRGRANYLPRPPEG